MKADMIELIFLVAIVVVCKLFELTKTGKKWKEKQKQREEAEREAAERVEAEWQKGLDDRVRVAEKTKSLSFEIPAMRPSEADAETKLPQADRIFIRREEPIKQESLLDRTPKVIERERAVKSAVQEHTKSVNKKYQAWLERNPTMRESEDVQVSQLTEQVREKTINARIPTSRDRLIEGIILAEVLGKPKAYRDRRRI